MWFEFQQDPSTSLLGNRLREDKDASRVLHYEVLAKMPVRGDGLDKVAATSEERHDWILDIF